METAISAITGDLISRVVSYLIKKCLDKPTIDENLERLQQLLLRIHAVVEEADGRYITNSRMLMQIKLLVASMYQGYHMLDTFRYRSLAGSFIHAESTTYSIPLKRSHTVPGILRSFAESNNLYIDNFMFGRHVEKQEIINFLLSGPGCHDAPMVLPLIGGCRVGKKTLVSHVCKNDHVRSRFSSILFIHGDSIGRTDDARFSTKMALVVAEFVTDVDDDHWVKFYSTIAEGSKVIIISRIQNLARFGTVKPIILNSLPREEYRYLFKILAFGSADEKDYPHLVSVANELAIVLNGSLVTANVIADLLRRNLDIQFWFRILRRFKGMVDYNLSKYGDHPKHILDNERSIDITTLSPSCPTSRFLMPPRVERDDCHKRKLAHISFGDLLILGLSMMLSVLS